jgi:phage head maturation protease
MKRKIKLQTNSLRAMFEPNTFNEERNTVDVIWTTGAQVKRFDYFEGRTFLEELSLARGHVKLDRLNAGAPVLNNHNSNSLGDVIGVVQSAEIRDGKGVATLKLSGREDVKPIVADIRAGILRNISVGYRVNKFEELKDEVDGMPVMRAVDWEPMELSFVGVPADKGAQVRAEETTNECEIINESEGTMGRKKRNDSAGEADESIVENPAPVEGEVSSEAPQSVEGAEPSPEASEAESAPAEVDSERKPEGEAKPEGEEQAAGERSAQVVDVQTLEIKRQGEIRKAVRAAKLDEAFADDLVERKVNVEDARKLVIDELERKTNLKTLNQRVEVNNMEQKELRKAAATRALLNRYKPETYALKGDEVEFRQGSLIDSARHFLAAEGVKEAYTMGRSELAKRALHHSSDFPEVLANVANKSLRDAYMGAPNTYSPFVSQRSVADFKEISSIQLGNGGKLEKVNESGEYKRTTVNEAAEKYKVEKYGVIVGRTWELIMNDDMDAFSRIPAQLGVRAREKENEIFWGLLLSNPTMAETGLALFSSGHGNLAGAGAAISVATIGAGRKAMRLFTDLEGELMSIAPSYLVVPAALETIAEQFVASVSPTQGSEVNPFSGKLKILAEPRLDASSAIAWHLFADSAKLSMAEMALIEGKGPEMFVREGFDVDGMELKIRHTFGMKLVDFRGYYKNPGA